MPSSCYFATILLALLAAGNKFRLISAQLGLVDRIGYTTVRIAVVVDKFGEKDAQATFTNQSLYEVFEKAKQASSMTIVHHYLDGQMILDRYPENRKVDVEPLFLYFDDAPIMKRSLNEGTNGDQVLALIEMATCSPANCDQLWNLAVDMPEMVIFSTCCYEGQSPSDFQMRPGQFQYHDYDDVVGDPASEYYYSGTDVAVSSNSTTTTPTIPAASLSKPLVDNFIYIGLHPNDMTDIILSLKKLYKWRRFHFLISPHWPQFDKFYETIKKKLAANDSSIVVTKSFYCSRYLAEGNLCESNQAKSIVLRQTTALMMLLEKTNDLPEFLIQLSELDDDQRASMMRGKAYFIINYSGLLILRADPLLLKKAPDGLMIIRHEFIHFDTADQTNNATNVVAKYDIYAYLYEYLRLTIKAAEAFKDSPEDFGRFSHLFCETVYQFDDGSSPFIFPVPCGDDNSILQILNVQHNINDDEQLFTVFQYNGTNFNVVATPVWPGSGTQAPNEDFCLLDGSMCPPIPPNYPAIVAPTIIGFLLISAIIGATTAALIAASRRRRRQAELLFAEIVASYSELEIANEDNDSMSGASSTDSRPSSSAGSENDRRTPLSFFQSSGPPTTGMQQLGRTTSNASQPNSNGNLLLGHRGATVKPIQQDEPVQDIAIPICELDIYDKQNKVRFRGDSAFVTRLRKSTCSIDQGVLEELIELRNVRHANINPFLAITPTPFRIYYIQAYCNKGTLAALLARRKIQLDRLFKLSFASDIAAGMTYLHQSPIGSHGRLTSECIFVDSRWFCRIGDIPLPKFEASGNDAQAELLNTLNAQSTSNTSTVTSQHGHTQHTTNTTHAQHTNSPGQSRSHQNMRKGSLWTAPELLRVDPPSIRGTQKADVYSFGIILQEIIIRQKPYGMFDLPEEVILRKINAGTFPSFRPKLPTDDETVNDLCDLAKLCWEEIPAFRPSSTGIVQILRKINKGKATNLIDQMVRMMQDHAERLEDLVEERTAALNDAMNRSEELLSKMLPKYVVDELKSGRTVEPETYEHCTVYFSDIVGFTALASDSTPLEIVDFLNDLYSQFDTIIDSYDVYKVETIGDAYMVCSGLPQRNGNRHAGQIATMALDILSCVTSFKIRHRPGRQLQLRCGIHSGPVVAGVVGLKMPRYCLFGDTVNYASRMESSGLALRIHVSPECKAILDELGGFHLVERGFVSMKGKGQIKTYFLLGQDGFDKVLPNLELAAPLSEHEFK